MTEEPDVEQELSPSIKHAMVSLEAIRRVSERLACMDKTELENASTAELEFFLSFSELTDTAFVLLKEHDKES